MVGPKPAPVWLFAEFSVLPPVVVEQATPRVRGCEAPFTGQQVFSTAVTLLMTVAGVAVPAIFCDPDSVRAVSPTPHPIVATKSLL